VSEAAALVVLAACLVAAVTRPRWAPDWAVAAGGAVFLVVVGVGAFGAKMWVWK
jgi:hypothetical protein